MNEGREPIRSYQRIFRPERRIYQLEGRALPVPGGVPLRWLAYATAALLGVLVISSGSATVGALLAICAALAGLVIGGRPAALVAGVLAFAGFWIVGAILGLLDWPLRIVVVPIAVATLATQATPDGRRADRFAVSWLALRLGPRRRSLGRGLPSVAALQLTTGSLWIAPDQHSPRLRRGRICGEGTASFTAAMRVRRRSFRARRLLARPGRGSLRRGEIETRRVAIGFGEALEVRP